MPWPANTTTYLQNEDTHITDSLTKHIFKLTKHDHIAYVNFHAREYHISIKPFCGRATDLQLFAENRIPSLT